MGGVFEAAVVVEEEGAVEGGVYEEGGDGVAFTVSVVGEDAVGGADDEGAVDGVGVVESDGGVVDLGDGDCGLLVVAEVGGAVVAEADVQNAGGVGQGA